MNIHTLLLDMVECMVCLEPKEDFRLLECAHSFCVACITALFSRHKFLDCPKCRAKDTTLCTSNDIGHLKKDFSKRDLFEKYKRSLAAATAPVSSLPILQPSVSFELCSLHDENKKTYCFDCASFLCRFVFLLIKNIYFNC